MQREIFISYRQVDAEGYAGWIYNQLRTKLSPNHMFIMDFDIGAGENWRDAVQHAISRCDVLLVIIGAAWLGARDEEGRRRLHNPDDIVRLELKTALDRKIQIIPLLVQDAIMPRAEQLPDDLKAFGNYQALQIRANSFDADVNQLLRRLQSARAQRWPWLLAGVVVLIGLLILGVSSSS